VFNLKKYSTLYDKLREYPWTKGVDPRKFRGTYTGKPDPQVEELVKELLLAHFGETYSEDVRNLAFSDSFTSDNLQKLFKLPLEEIKTFTELKRKQIINKAASKLRECQNLYGLSDEIICEIAINTLKKSLGNQDIKDEISKKFPQDYKERITKVYGAIESGIKKGVLKKDNTWKNICLNPEENKQIIMGLTDNQDIINFFENLQPVTMGDITLEAFGIYAARKYKDEPLYIDNKINPRISENVISDLFSNEDSLIDEDEEDYEDYDEDGDFISSGRSKKDDLNERVKFKILNSLKSENPSKASMDLRQLCKRFARALPPEEAHKLPIYIERIRFPKQYDIDAYLNYLAEILIGAGYQETWVKGIILPTVKDEYKLYTQGIPDPEFGENSRTFSSVAEKEAIVNVIRNEFNLTCIPSGINIPVPAGVPAGEIPKTNDPNNPYDRFRIDFVIYSDALSFAAKNGKYVPEIKPNIMLIGEYYGLTGNINYDKKTKIKEATESYFAHALGCGYFDLMPGDEESLREQVKIGLDRNNALYITKDPEIRSKAVERLAYWKSIASKEAISSFIQDEKNLNLATKYINFKTNQLNIKPIKYNRFIGLVRSCRNRLDSESAEKALLALKSDEKSNSIYSFNHVQEWYEKWLDLSEKLQTEDLSKQALRNLSLDIENPIKDLVKSPIEEGRKNNAWKYSELDSMESELERIPEENVNRTNLCGLIYRLTDKQTKEAYWKKLRREFPLIEQIKQIAFNLYRHIKQGFTSK